MDDQPRLTLRARLFNFIRRYFLWLVVLFALVLLALSFEAGRSSVYRAHPELSGAEQAAQILAKVGALIQLPANETPTMATINDAASAKRVQPFLASAANGDILIVYPSAAEALLYRPSANKLIAVGPVNNAASAPAIQPPPPAATSTSISSGKATNATTTKSRK